MDAYLTATTVAVSYNEEDRLDRAIRDGIQYLLYKTGPMTLCVCEAGAFVRTTAPTSCPQICRSIKPTAYAIDYRRQPRVGSHGMTVNSATWA